MTSPPKVTNKQAASRSKRTYHSKSTTGCRTCKIRRVKCDETRPICLRCSKSGRLCDGYAPPRKAWIFEPQQTTTTALPSESSDDITVNQHPSVDKRSSIILDSRSPSSQHPPQLCASVGGPYKRREEQYFLKYFLEVIGPSLARSKTSGPFWLTELPQVSWHLRGARYALLALAIGWDETSKDIFTHLPVHQYNASAIDYESRAMVSVVQESRSVEGVLVTSMAFWMIAMISGDYARSVQHCYFTQKILRDLDRPEKCNIYVLNYCKYISRATLEYFRVTRGPCKLHLSPNLLDCEASCFTPDDHPLGVRVTNTLFHLRQAWPEYVAAKKLLVNRTPPHSQGPMLLEVLDKTLREFRFLTRRWSDHSHLKLPVNFQELARPFIPYNRSPFLPIIDSLREYIQNDHASSVDFRYLELKMRVTQPNLCLDTSRQSQEMMSDTAFLLSYGSIWGNTNRKAEPVKAELLWTMMEDWTTEEEANLLEAANASHLELRATP